MAYSGKYKGFEIDALLDEITPILQELEKKVSKVDGKQLSTEDFTTALKNKLNSLSNYDDTAIQTAVSDLRTQLNTLVSGDASTAIDSFNDIIAFLEGIEDSQSLDSIIASIEQQIADKADKKDIPTKVSELENDVPYAVDGIDDGVYAVTSDGKLVGVDEANSTCVAVALVQGSHTFMIEKSEDYSATTDIYLWDNALTDTAIPNFTKVGGGSTGSYGYLKVDGTGLNRDYTTWSEGTALGDFNGKSNSDVLKTLTGSNRNIGYCLNDFNNGVHGNNQGFTDWYIPSCGQMGLIIIYADDINAMMQQIGGVSFVKTSYWTSSEYASRDAWYVNFWDNSVGMYGSNKDDYTEFRVRFIRDIEVLPSIRGLIAKLNEKKQDTIPDLETIRSGASAGATAVQPEDLVEAVYITDFSIEEIFNMGDAPVLEIDGNALKAAIIANKIIVVPYSKNYSIGGGYVADIEAWEDEMFINIHGADYTISFYIYDDAINEIDASEITITSLQTELVSGENIKTINGESILNSGNLELATKAEVNDKADDLEVVHITGNESIKGEKTFNRPVYFKDTGSLNLGAGVSIKDSNAASILGVIQGCLSVNHTEQPLFLFGQNNRPKYNNNELALLSDVDSKQDKALKFTNLTASSWVEDTTYSDYPYRCDVACSGVTTDMYAEVVFDLDQATSGDYAPLCETKANAVAIWSKVNSSITVPLIVITT